MAIVSVIALLATTGCLGPDGGEVELLDGGAHLVVPPGALTENMVIDAKPAPGTLDANLVPGSAIEIARGNKQPVTFLVPATLTLRYDPAALGDRAEGLLSLFTYSGQSSTWEAVAGSAVDLDAKTVTGGIAGTGYYALGVHSLDPGWQSPFLCRTEAEGLGQPIVDNQGERGTPVYPEVGGQVDRTQAPLGWSEGCQAPARYVYRYVDTGGTLRDLPEGTTTLPSNTARLNVSSLVGAADMDLGGATQVPYLIRQEIGTQPENRFFYSIAMLISWDEYLARDTVEPGKHWNRRLLYEFGGGVAIGHSQGEVNQGDALQDRALRLGYGVLYSTGTVTYTHYNLALGGRTAVEAKQMLIDRHGEPRYTLGGGGSGGGVQQYVYGQNLPGLIDGAMPRVAYPDMSTQMIHTGDCELLAHYMDRIDNANPRWSNWDNRRILQGMNTRHSPSRQTTCIAGFRSWSNMNPTVGFPWGLGDVINDFVPEMVAKATAGAPIYPDDFPDLGRLLRTHEDPDQWVQWGHWNDAREVYGTNPDTGLANVTWDNVGVQYGLRAVARGQITPGEFLDLNARIGSWREPEDQVRESCAQIGSTLDALAQGLAEFVGMCTPGAIDPYSARNMVFSQNPAVPAPRRSADVAGITGAFELGIAFSGAMPRKIPILDFRQYRDHALNMHITDQSFAARERILREEGNADHHLIWVLDIAPASVVNATRMLQFHQAAYRVMDEWLLKIEAHPTGDVVASKPATAVDQCRATDGSILASGPDVWSGAVELIQTGEGVWTDAAPTEVDGVPVGPCAAHFPLHSTSRVVAGAPVAGDVYKCHTKPVADSIADGDYGVWEPTTEQVARLELIFPDGVCDYSRPSVGRP